MDDAGDASPDEPSLRNTAGCLQGKNIMKTTRLIALLALGFTAAAAQANGPAGYDPLAFLAQYQTEQPAKLAAAPAKAKAVEAKAADAKATPAKTALARVEPAAAEKK